MSGHILQACPNFNTLTKIIEVESIVLQELYNILLNLKDTATFIKEIDLRQLSNKKERFSCQGIGFI